MFWRQYAHHAGRTITRSPSANLWRQFRQLWRALQLEWHLSKRDILTPYLNRAPFGGTLQGVGGKLGLSWNSPAISYSDAALLAVLPQAPARCVRIAGRTVLKRREESARTYGCPIFARQTGESRDRSARPPANAAVSTVILAHDAGKKPKR
ncbi:transglycosylase domain-containing protein [Shigella flexneri]